MHNLPLREISGLPGRTLTVLYGIGDIDLIIVSK